jgi:CheY-like chemotaxis protein
MRALIVDDDGDILDLAAELFSMSDIEAFPCSSAQAAIEALETETFDAIVCDIVMAGMTGLEFHKAIKANGTLVRPFVFISGYSSENPEAEALVASGDVDKIFLKPLQFYEIADYIKRTKKL